MSFQAASASCSYLGTREVESETEEELFEEDTEEDEKEEDANDGREKICRITSYHMFYKSVAVSNRSYTTIVF